jgi:capsular polysaccharide biosynthesis protein
MANNHQNHQSYQDFKTYLDIIGSETITEEELDELYEENVTIEFNHHSITVPFDAVIYNKLVDLIDTLIKEY